MDGWMDGLYITSLLSLRFLAGELGLVLQILLRCRSSLALALALR